MTRKLPFSPEKFREIYSRVPRLCVDLIIKDDRGVLLTLRQKNGWEGKWHLPGGTVYLQESMAETVNRVAQEELGIKVKIDKNVGFIEYPSEKSERGYGYSVSLAFLCTPESRDIRLDDQVKSFAFHQSLPENMITEQRNFLKVILFR